MNKLRRVVSSLLIVFLLITLAFLSISPVETVFAQTELEDITLTVACASLAVPFCTFEEGIAVGIMPEILEYIKAEAKLDGYNLIISFIQSPLLVNADGQILNNEIDMVLDAALSADWSAYGYKLSQPYLSISYSLLRLKSQKADKANSVAVCAAPTAENTHAKYYIEESRLRTYQTAEKCIEAVWQKECTSAVLTSFAAERAVREDVKIRLVSSVLGESEEICFAVKQGISDKLLAILNPIIQNKLTQNVKSEIIARHTASMQPKATFTTYFYSYPYEIAIAITLLAIVAFTIPLLLLRGERIKREYKRAEEEAIKNQALSDALAAAEKADNAKNQFLSRVSHEMRTPLNAIIGFMNLSKSADMEQIQSNLANSEVAAKQLLCVINDVLDMSAIESGKMKIAHSPFSFKQVIQSIVGIYSTQCALSGIEFESKILAPIGDWLVGDPLRLNQILMNLLDNAVKFTEKGRVILQISRLHFGEQNVVVRFEIIDTGCGMSEEVQSRVFKAFEQIDSTAQKFVGSGLGLSIVQHLVAMMQGTIKLESTPGVGTTFTVDIPFELSESIVEDTVPGMDSTRILVVDDQSADCDYFSVILDNLKVRHTIVKSGEAALKVLDTSRNDSFNICLVDWQMPVMDGLELSRCIRQEYPEMKIIVMSSYEHYEAAEEAKKAGADLFLTKPLFQSTLFDLLVELTKGQIATKNTEVEVDEKELSGRRVLLAEDNLMNRVVAVGLLDKLGIECVTAEDGVVAVEKFVTSSEGYFDAVLMDIRMPNMDGFDATAAIRCSAHPDAERVQIIALTANAFNEDIAKSLSCGMNYHITKPIEMEVFFNTLRTAFAVKDTFVTKNKPK